MKTAAELAQYATECKNELIEKQKDVIEQNLVLAAGLGLSNTSLDNVYDENVAWLKQLGYKIVKKGTNKGHLIFWSDINCRIL